MYQEKMDYAEMEKFDEDILGFENPQLQRYLINGETILEEHQGAEYLLKVKEYVEMRKTNFQDSIPKWGVYLIRF